MRAAHAPAPPLRRFCCFWAINGILQGFGGPCCARILTSWFATGERGTYWGMWNIAHNLGGFMAPIICGEALLLHSWPRMRQHLGLSRS